MQTNPPIPKTIWEWFQFSKGDRRGGRRSAFFESLPQLSDDRFIDLIKNAATDSCQGNLRPLTELREEGRRKVPPLNQLLEELRNPENRRERQLQYLLWHRGHLLNPRQRMIAREVPCSLRKVKRPTVTDFLIIDDLRRVPLVVEVKCGSASDSLTGVLLELLVQWCFYKSAMSAFRQQLQDDGEQIDDSMAQPEAAIVAPIRFYREALRRSNTQKRHGEAVHALRFLRALEDAFDLRVRFIVLSNNWHFHGTRLRCHQLRTK